ncbi:alpha-1,2-fucosyltransferase [Mucilaginibacter sp. AW1-7]|uniref:alpha-1,2-fucosyltransferase n=1 Tax=Mucilaginibacter sp. AW1-7 TaxID=3349874 RepID=UPI003F73DA5A
MIGIKIQGRFGNQLFQYAFAYAAAKKLRTTFYMDQREQEVMIQDYFDIPFSFSIFFERRVFRIRGFRNFFTVFLKEKFYRLLQRYTAYSKAAFPADAEKNEVISRIQNNTFFEGYFLSEDYFREYGDDLREFFRVKQHFRTAYQKKYGQLFSGKKIVAVHIRKSDYLNLGHLNLGGSDLSLPMDYYHHILASLQAVDTLFVFVSDDTSMITGEFSYIPNKLVSASDMISDFQHLLNADICVIANSTFSWWGAWLNTKPHKKIYAPEHFMGHIIDEPWPDGIYPPDWELVNVNKTINPC